MHILYDNIFDAKITDFNEIPVLIWECQSYLKVKLSIKPLHVMFFFSKSRIRLNNILLK